MEAGFHMADRQIGESEMIGNAQIFSAATFVPFSSQLRQADLRLTASAFPGHRRLPAYAGIKHELVFEPQITREII
jgi:hypothetical protein